MLVEAQWSPGSPGQSKTQLLGGGYFSSPFPSTLSPSHFHIARFLLVQGRTLGLEPLLRHPVFTPLRWGGSTYQAVLLGPLAGHHFVSTPGKLKIGRRTTGTSDRGRG